MLGMYAAVVVVIHWVGVEAEAMNLVMRGLYNVFFFFFFFFFV